MTYSDLSTNIFIYSSELLFTSIHSFSMYLLVHCYEPNTVPDAEDKMHKDPACEEFIFLYFGLRN